jgi:hypothetical protein
MDVMKIPETLIPLSHVELDLPAPTIGWAAGMAEKGIEVVLDDLGRLNIRRRDAKRLFDEHRQAQERAQAKQREVVQASDRWHQEHYVKPSGIHWTEIPVGMTTGEYLAVHDPDRQRPRRRSVLEDSLAGGGIVFHSLEEQAEGES